MTRKKARGVSYAELRRIALAFPAASEGTSYGKPSFLIGGKFFTRLRSEDDSLVLVVDSIDERDMLLESDPALFHITDHYRNYPAVLARRTAIDAVMLRGMLERRWRAIAPKKLVKEFETNASAVFRPVHESSKPRSRLTKRTGRSRKGARSSKQ